MFHLWYAVCCYHTTIACLNRFSVIQRVSYIEPFAKHHDIFPWNIEKHQCLPETFVKKVNLKMRYGAKYGHRDNFLWNNDHVIVWETSFNIDSLYIEATKTELHCTPVCCFHANEWNAYYFWTAIKTDVSIKIWEHYRQKNMPWKIKFTHKQQCRKGHLKKWKSQCDLLCRPNNVNNNIWIMSDQPK